MKKRALFVGVDRYEDGAFRDLKYSVADAAALAAAFGRYGYDTHVATNPGTAELLKEVRRWTADLESGDVFLFFFAGHGFTGPGGEHLLICRDDELVFLRHNRAGVSVDVLEDLTNGKGFHRAFLLDACRTDVFAGQANRGGETRDLGLVALPDAGKYPGTCCVIRSCDRFCPALEYEDLGHGVFTRALLDLVDDDASRGIPLGDAFVSLLRSRMNGILAAHGMSAEQNPCSQANGNPFHLFEVPPPSSATAPAASGPVVCSVGASKEEQHIAELERKLEETRRAASRADETRLSSEQTSTKKRWVYLLLGIFLGWVGLQFAYAGKWLLFGLLWALFMLTFLFSLWSGLSGVGDGLCLAWWIFWIAGTIFISKDGHGRKMKWS